jgi:TonB family protein
LIGRQGMVRRAEVLKSTDAAFDKYALKYAKQYRFKVDEQVSKLKKLWICLPIRFGQ